MSRGLWFAAGTGAGLYAALRARRAAELLTVEGLRDRAGAAVLGLRMLRDEVAQGRADAEPDLRRRMGLALVEHGDHRELAASSAGRTLSVADDDHESRAHGPRAQDAH